MIVKQKKIEVLLMKANDRTSNRNTYTEQCLKKMADNKCFFYENKQLIFRGNDEEFRDAIKTCVHKETVGISCRIKK